MHCFLTICSRWWVIIFMCREWSADSRWCFRYALKNKPALFTKKPCDNAGLLYYRDCEKKSVNKILLWYARVASLKIRLLTLVLYITVVEWHVKSRRFSARLIRLFIRYSGRRPSYIILSSPYTCAQLRIVLVHFFVASNVARYSAFNRAVSLGKTLLWRFSFR